MNRDLIRKVGHGWMVTKSTVNDGDDIDSRYSVYSVAHTVLCIPRPGCSLTSQVNSHVFLKC